MKQSALTILLIFSCVNFLVCQNGKAYTDWLDQFKSKLDDCSTNISRHDLQELNNIIGIKPEMDTGKYYGEWFDNFFKPFFSNLGPVLNKSEIALLDLVIKSKTSLHGSEKFYIEYLKYVISKLTGQYLPVFSKTDQKLAQYLKNAQPSANSEENYSDWLKQMKKIQNNFGTNVSKSEQLIIDIIMELKPDLNRTDDGKLYQVSEETLLKIKYLILNNGTYKAVQEIERILKSQ